MTRHPAADPRPLVICDVCESAKFHDRAIHNGRSTVRECSACRRFMGFPVWYGEESPPRPPASSENALSDQGAHLP